MYRFSVSTIFIFFFSLISSCQAGSFDFSSSRMLILSNGDKASAAAADYFFTHLNKKNINKDTFIIIRSDDSSLSADAGTLYLEVVPDLQYDYEIKNTAGRLSLFAKDKAVEDLKNGKVVFLAGGIGHPYFSTDTTTALRSIELECDVILMARAVDGVYDSDPKKNPNAVKYDCVSYKKLIDDDLKVFDHTASILCRENKMPSLIFALEEENAIYNNCFGNQTGTLVTVE